MRRSSGAARACRATVQGSRGLLPLIRSATERNRDSGATGYTGRFAPSPTGPLHPGSLFAAATSYLHARRAKGEWLVRIEDIDPPREVRGAADDILRTLEAYGLHWDGAVRYQSRHLSRYQEIAGKLLTAGLAFPCRCTRRQLQAAGGIHSGRCSGTSPARTDDRTLRILVDQGAASSFVRFSDGFQGVIDVDLGADHGDYVIMRRDGLPAYHLAVVADDAEQGVTDVVRGVDLLAQTGVHIQLQRLLGYATPRYMHLPVLVNAAGQKLSKQTGATAVPSSPQGMSSMTVQLLELLGVAVPPESRGAPPADLWRWASDHWYPSLLAGSERLPAP